MMTQNQTPMVLHTPIKSPFLEHRFADQNILDSRHILWHVDSSCSSELAPSLLTLEHSVVEYRIHATYFLFYDMGHSGFSSQQFFFLQRTYPQSHLKDRYNWKLSKWRQKWNMSTLRNGITVNLEVMDPSRSPVLLDFESRTSVAAMTDSKNSSSWSSSRRQVQKSHKHIHWSHMEQRRQGLHRNFSLVSSTIAGSILDKRNERSNNWGLVLPSGNVWTLVGSHVESLNGHLSNSVASFSTFVARTW